ncbi:MAG: inositol phosphatase [Myxococcales bacterium]|nr:inositol phosphatase [Myxococcales bacterium]MDH3486170.1 inositol phosphatase [Myxococcales bacterium]
MGNGFDADRIGGSGALHALTDVIVRAGEIALKHFDRGVIPERKPDRSPVTAADREVEQVIRDYVMERYPHAEFYGEETGRHGDNAELRFIVDPIDGTRAFIRGLPTWSVLLGIEVEGSPVVGIAYMPSAGDLFVGALGQGTTHNGEQAHVSKVTSLSDATVMHGSLQQFTEAGVGDTLVGLAGACDSARGYPDFDGYRQVLLGRADAMVDPGVKPWDICAAAVLIREAGGRLTSMTGEETIYGGSAVASNGAIHDDLVAALGATSKG